jgi:hypothetical protein
MIYVYALCPNPESPLSLPAGMATPQVELLGVGQLGAIAEPNIDIAQVKEDDAQLMDAVLAHDRVLGHLFDQTPLLPLRFGTQFKDRDSLSTFLTSHEATYRTRLATLQDKAEYLLKLVPKPLTLPDVDAALKGREYFLEKKRRLQAYSDAQTQQAEELQTFLTTLDAHGIPFVQSSPHEGEERLHLLLARDVAQTQALVTQWQQPLSVWQLICSEPLPPYHFAA